MAPELSQTRFKSIKRSVSALGSSEAKIQTGTQSQSSREACILKSCCDSCTFCSYRRHLFQGSVSSRNASFLPKHVGGVSSVSQSASVANVRDAPAVVTSPPIGGRLQVFWQTWASMGASPRVLSILKNCYTLPFQTKPPLTREPLIRSGYVTSVRQNLLQESVRSLLAKQAIKRVHNPSSLGFYNCLFLVPKPNDRWRPILDLSALNRFLHVKTFKMKTPESIRLSLQQGEWVTLLDFSDAYLYIPINPVSRKYLLFHLEDQTAVLSLTVQPLYRCYGVYHCGQGGKAHGSGKGNPFTPVPRWLANTESDQRILLLPDTGPADPLSGTRLGRESSQVRIGPKAGLRLCRVPVRPEPRSSPTHSAEMADLER